MIAKHVKPLREDVWRVQRLVEMIEMRLNCMAESQNIMRATLDQLLLQQKHNAEHSAVGLAALMQAEIETEEEREQREKLEKEFEEFQDVMKRLEEV